MKVGELKEVLKHADDDLNLRVLVYKQGIGGARPSVGVKSVTVGFDWEHGMLVISPDTTLKERE